MVTGSDGPFGTATDISIGFSHTTLLVVSLLGFLLLGFAMYWMLFVRLRDTFDEDDTTNKRNLDYNAILETANVATLNRAQRRARANLIRRRQRRCYVQNEDLQMEDDDTDLNRDNDDVDNHNNDDINAENDADNDDDRTNSATAMSHMSRKDRQRAAKEVERLERQRYQRLRQQEVELANQKLREKKNCRQAEIENERNEKRQQYLKQKEELDRLQSEEWNIFLKSPYNIDTDNKNNNNDETRVMTVENFVSYCRQHKQIILQDLSDQYQVPIKVVQERIQILIQTHRITGIFLKTKMNTSIIEGHNEQDQQPRSTTQFLFVSEESLVKAVDYIRNSKQQGTWESLAEDKNFISIIMSSST